MSNNKLDNIYKYHAPKDDQPRRYKALRIEARCLAELFISCCPESRERSLALTNLEQAVMWANAAIANNES
jgi:hypothetical protein